ncbi:hypothetical protein EC2865200_2663 [Escherichia coli 2865200]|nr:hypothetical protein EC2865200_2663 [Escherichia coli 2865200]
MSARIVLGETLALCDGSSLKNQFISKVNDYRKTIFIDKEKSI